MDMALKETPMLGWWLDLMFLKEFSNLNESMTLWFEVHLLAKNMNLQEAMKENLMLQRVKELHILY